MKSPKTTYSWRDGYAPGRSMPPQEVGQLLEKIRKRNGGTLTAENVLAAASDPESLLHKFFEWNNEKAAEEYRLGQARDMLRALIVTVPAQPIERGVRAFVNVIQPNGDRGYTSMMAAMADNELRQQVLRRALRELKSFQRRYEEYEELAAVMRAIDETVKGEKRVA